MKITITVGKQLPNQLCGKIHLMKKNKPLCGAKIKEMYTYDVRSYLTVDEMVGRFVSCKSCRRMCNV